MKVIVATSESQGERTTDYHFAIEGELIEIQEPCGRDRRAGPGEVGCGCSRGFAGLSSHRATTTVRIAEIPGLTVADYVSALEASLETGGWDPSDAAELAKDLLALVEGWPVGAILERSFEFIGVRRMAVIVP